MRNISGLCQGVPRMKRSFWKSLCLGSVAVLLSFLTACSHVNENYEKTLGLIIKVVNSMKRVTDDEVKRSITEITSSLKESQDDLYNYILPIYASKLYNEKDIKTKIKEIQKVTKEDVEKLFDKIHVTDSFFFKGGKTSE